MPPKKEPKPQTILTRPKLIIKYKLYPKAHTDANRLTQTQTSRGRYFESKESEMPYSSEQDYSQESSSVSPSQSVKLNPNAKSFEPQEESNPSSEEEFNEEDSVYELPPLNMVYQQPQIAYFEPEEYMMHPPFSRRQPPSEQSDFSRFRRSPYPDQPQPRARSLSPQSPPEELYKPDIIIHAADGTQEYTASGTIFGPPYQAKANRLPQTQTQTESKAKRNPTRLAANSKPIEDEWRESKTPVLPTPLADLDHEMLFYNPEEHQTNEKSFIETFKPEYHTLEKYLLQNGHILDEHSIVKLLLEEKDTPPAVDSPANQAPLNARTEPSPQPFSVAAKPLQQNNNLDRSTA